MISVASREAGSKRAGSGRTLGASARAGLVALVLGGLAAAGCDQNQGATAEPSPAKTSATSAQTSAAKATSAATSAANEAPSSEAKPGSSAPSEPANALAPSASGAPSATSSAAPATPATVAPDAKTTVALAVTTLPKGTNGVLAAGAADKLIVVGGKPIVSVSDTGKAPKSNLSYDVAKGAKESYGLGMDMSMKMDLAGKSMPAMALPRMNMAMDFQAKDKNPANEIFVDARVSGISLDAKDATQKQMASALQGQLDGLKGLTMSYWVSPKGNVRDVKTTVPPNAPQAAQQMLQGMSQSVESMVAPLPSEEVGVGAKWTVLTRVASGGADIVQLARYTLKEKNGTKLTLDMEVEQVAAKDAINAPGMPAGVSAKLTAFDSGGKGTMTLDTKNMGPDSGTMKVLSKMGLAVDAQGKQEKMSMEMTIGVEFTRPKGK